MKTTKKMIGTAALAAALAVAGCSTNSNNSDELMTSSLAGRKPGGIQTFSVGSQIEGCFVSEPGTNAVCGGPYYGTAVFTNDATGTLWFTPPTGTTNGLATDSSGIGSPYLSSIQVTRSDGFRWCGTNSVSFPATSSRRYKFTIYVLNETPPPTNGQSLSLDIGWNP